MDDMKPDVVPTLLDPPPSVDVTLIAKLNLADFQNSVPMIRELSIINDSSEEAKELVLTVESVPAFVKKKTWRVDAVGAGQRCRITALDVQLDGALLTRLTEAEKATVTFVLRRIGEPPEELARLERSVELLPRNHWGGLSHLPDLVAAFVQPNEPVVERLLKQAADVLRKNGKNPALDGYKGGSKRAWELASGIWSAVAAMGLDYALPPASFEITGQKVRGPAQLAESGLATCLDLALLFCSVIEQAGLNPLLVFMKDHVFAGVWLKPEEFSTTVVDDITALRKRVKLNELVLFETTVITHPAAPPFSHAIILGAHQISEENEGLFVLAVDIRRARLQRIKPLASADAPVAVPPAERSSVIDLPLEEAPDLPEECQLVEPDPATLNPKDRLARWQRKLLDLSLRNNLLNFRSSKKALKLEAPNPGALEDLLSDGQALKLLPRPDLMDGADPRNRAIYEGREREDVRREHALDALKRREVFVGVPKEELESRLVELYRAARTSLQEGGANTLFIALGFLSWTRDDKDDKHFRAPLVLVPVTLNRRSARSGFTITLHDDEPRFNPTLIEMLRQDFKLNLGIADGELPKDDAGLDVDAIWKSVSFAIKDIKGWEVAEEVVLAMFSFAKYLMWKDLAERTDQLRENAVVRHLIDTPRESYPSVVPFPNPKWLDNEFAPEQIFCPLPADSSQLSAVMAAAKGKDYVLIGPPGTGKSQTIANIISQCLAEGKRVLFVAEKIAALDVVYRRLREVGLGEFCLELHSNKTRKLDLLAQLQKSWEARGSIDPVVWRAEAQRLKRLREQLNHYVERLHNRHGNGMTIHEAIGCVVDGTDVPLLGFSWCTPEAHGSTEMEALRDIVDRLEINAQAVGQSALVGNPLSAIGHSDWSPSWQQGVIEAARCVTPAAQAVEQAYEQFIQFAGLPRASLNRSARVAIGILARSLPNAAGRDWRFVLRVDARTISERLQEGGSLLDKHRELSDGLSSPWPESVVKTCKRGLGLLQQRREITAQIGQPWSADIVEMLKKGLILFDMLDQATKQLSVQYCEQIDLLDVTHLHREWNKAEKAYWPMSWIGKRKIRTVLEPLTVGEGPADVAKDLRLLVKIRALRSEISDLEIAPAADGIWNGLKTKPELVRCALEFQPALRAVQLGMPWKDEGFEPIEHGRCGERLAKELGLLRTQKALDIELSGLEDIGSPTGGLWAGLDTRIESLEAGLRFQAALKDVRESGALPGDHDEVACGECGENLSADFYRLRDRADVEKKLIAYEDLRDLTAGLWNGLKTKSDDLEKALIFQVTISTAIANLVSTPEEIAAIKASLDRLIGDGNALLEPSGPIVRTGKAYLNACDALQPNIDRLASAGSFSDSSNTEFGDIPINELIERCMAIVRSENRLHGWCAWRKVREKALMFGLLPLVAGVENGAVPKGTVRRAFETNYSRWWLNAVVDREPVLREFVSAEHEKRIDDFRALDDRFTELTRAYVRAGLCAELPTQDNVSRNSEWGILQHEIYKKKRHMPLRELMMSIPTAMTKLTPCMLMSPLSIAQYLSADATTFDVVVFDEASQIPVWDAVGALARGRQVVMVGDPKQLPPTNFFDRAESLSDEEDIEGDLESILDECLGANLPTMNLSWHYRSRHESLIAFSNHHYYGGALVTFPSPVTEDHAVSFHYVKGIYEKGGARINKIEAKALVADLVGRLKSPGFRDSKMTIGVVTFNSEQQTLIEDLLDEERRNNPSIEPYFAEVELEPVFVKNLESVQGDERDIMYFSITYGPDLSGAVSMNYGPMNREGGERRLNVAITRARHELRVFSSLKAEQMDLARTQSIGVRDLKLFLEFAERGPRALAEGSTGSLGDFESPFEESVASALVRKGWVLHTQVGVSTFRVDLAVVHPDAPGAYLAGIECDGATYHRSATARDRDKLREQVLRGLGWEILHVWSTDWWIDATGALEKLDGKIQSVLGASRARRIQEAEKAAARQSSAVAKAKSMNEVARTLTHTSTGGDGASVSKTGDLSLLTEAAFAVPVAEQALDEVYAGNVSRRSPALSGEFVEADPTSVIDAVNPDKFFDTSYDPVLARMIAHVVEVEGPVRGLVLARRIARAHGWQRTGSRIQERVEFIAVKAYQTTEEDVGTFYWAPGRGPEMPVAFRRATDEWFRNVDEVCMLELVALAREVLASDKEGEVAIAAMAHELGLQRVRASSRGRYEKAMSEALDE